MNIDKVIHHAVREIFVVRNIFIQKQSTHHWYIRE